MSRYIDADKLLNTICDKGLDCDALMIAISEQPTADVRENVKGEWIACEHNKWMHGTYALRCSKCNGGYHLSTEKHMGTWNYCPNCGADMRGD